MKTSLIKCAFLVIVIIGFACQSQPSVLTDAQKSAVADSAKAVARDVTRGLQMLDGPAVLGRFSSDPDASFMENGFLYGSYSALRDSLSADLATLDSLSTQIDATDVVVLGADAAVVSESFHFVAKTKAGGEVEGQGVASMVVQQRAGRWQIVQSHESELAVAEVDSTLVPPIAKGKPVQK